MRSLRSTQNHHHHNSMKTAVTLKAPDEWGNIGTIILTGDIETDNKLVTEACECSFSGKVEFSKPIDWEHLGMKPMLVIYLTVTGEDEDDNREAEVTMECTAIFEAPAKPTYFLFGSEAVDIYNEEGIDALIDAIEDDNLGCDTFEHILSETLPCDLLDAFQGWDDYAVITKEEFDRI